MTFEPYTQPVLPPAAASLPDLPPVKPGGKPYLGAYLKPANDKTLPSPSKITSVKSPSNGQAPSPAEIVAKIAASREPKKTAPVERKKISSQPARQDPSSSQAATHSSSKQAASGSYDAVGTGLPAVRASGSGSLAGSSGTTEGLLEDEVIALSKTTPEYPRKAARSGEEGWVKIEFTITAQGEVTDPKVVASKPRRIFDRAALKAIRKWRFKPRTVNGKAVPRRAVQVIEFRLATG